jgi:hypothetical protein
MTTTTQPAAPLAVSEVLRIAQQDAESVYRDLSDMKIILTLRGDVWHVDYELTDPLSAGGGPHYVIDANTGAIVSKHYDQ